MNPVVLGQRRTASRRICARVHRPTEVGDGTPRKRDERFDLDLSTFLCEPARVHLVQFNGVTLGIDSYPHPITVGSQYQVAVTGPRS